ncbi:hypothetical protein B0H10DRAFT_1951661 [Mycena sp. CBHHK59/15]|nr:hypothetical protein B0H10DRAFT_1951661 [Mycena sp. CBHHK59/15]
MAHSIRLQNTQRMVSSEFFRGPCFAEAFLLSAKVAAAASAIPRNTSHHDSFYAMRRGDDVAQLSLLCSTTAPSATFCKIPLTISVEPASPKSLISVDWILSSEVPAPLSCASGVLTLPSGATLCSMNMKISVASAIAYYLVLGRDWILFCRQTLPHASFSLSSGVFYPAQPRNLPFSVHPTAQDLDTQPQLHGDNNDMQPQASGHGCGCDEPLGLGRKSLIAHHELYRKIIEGTLVLVKVSLVTYIITGQITENGAPKPDRKVYHILVDQLKILDYGDGEPWNVLIPSLPERRYYSPMTPKRHRDTAADDAFNNFGSRSSPSPAKRGRRAGR